MRSVRGIFFAGVCASALIAAPYAFPVPPAGIAVKNDAVTFEDRSGMPLGTILSADQQRASAVSIDRVSPWFLKAVVASEDERFYSHGPVDWLAVLRVSAAAARCLCNAGGASTIDMQVARMRFGLPGGVRGKLLQVWNAARIDAGSDKNAVLQAYVNRVAMGGNVYGVEAAAREYFGVPAKDLDVAQSALLAGIPNDPAQLEPRANWAAARARQRYVLQRMAGSGVISVQTARLASRETMHLLPPGSGPIAAQQLLFRLASAAGEPRIRTTIDLPLQRFVQAQARDVVEALNDRNLTQAAVLVVDNRTGEVLAYLGSLDYFDDAYLGSNDGVESLRQPGSTLKPFLYEYALERRVIEPDTVLADVPTSYAIPGAQIYSPEDYSTQFSGPVSVRSALANSLNVPAVRVLSRVGVPPFLDRLRDLGFSRLTRSPSFYGLGLTLGAGEVTLWDLTHAYVTMARGGSAIPLRTIASDAPVTATPVGSPADWRLVTNILADRYARVRSFGRGSVLDMPFDAAVKTGTSSGYRDTWTVGYTPEYTVGVWAGNFSGAPMQRISGVAGAGPLWNRIMLHLYERKDPPAFPLPPHEMLTASLLRPSLASARSAAFDEWRSREGKTTGTLRILFPQDGDIFEDALASGDPARSAQQIAFTISRPRNDRVRWQLNGATLAFSSGDTYYWPVRTGHWDLKVSLPSGRSQEAVFTVIPRVFSGKPGFVSGP